MIARLWRGRAGTPKDADAYQRHVTSRVLPELKGIPGHRSAQVLRRGEEFLVITFWESMDAIHAFAGPDVEKAVYYPDDAEYLLEMEPGVAHYEALVSPDER